MLLEHDDIEFVEEQETGSDESMAFPLAPLKLSDLNAHVFPLLSHELFATLVFNQGKEWFLLQHTVFSFSPWPCVWSCDDKPSSRSLPSKTTSKF